MKLASYNGFVNDMQSKGIEYAAERAARQGFEAVELLEFCTEKKFTLPRANAAYARRVLRENGLAIACYSVAAKLYEPNAEQTYDRMCRHIEWAAEAGSPYLHHTVTMGLSLTADSPDYREMLETVLPTAERIASKCAEYGMVCLYEPQGMYFNGTDGLSGLFDEVNRRTGNVRICGDLGNSLFVDTEPAEVVRRFASDIKHVHVKDYAVLDAPLEDERGYRSAGGRYLYDRDLGRGDIDLDECFRQLREARYDGYVSLELIKNDDDTVEGATEFVRRRM